MGFKTPFYCILNILYLFVEFVEFGTSDRHVGDESLDIENEGHDRVFTHGLNRTLTGTKGNQCNVAVNPGFPSLAVAEFFQGFA